MMSEILVIRNIQVYDVSAQQNSLIIGSPSPATFCGAALALCRKLDVDYVSTAVIVHEFALNRGHSKFVPHEASEKAASTSDLVTGDLRLSLLIEVQRKDPIPDASDSVAMELDAYRIHVLKTQTRRHVRNIAGGRVVVPPALSEIAVYEDQPSALRAIRPFGGTVLMDRSDLLVGYDDPLASIIAHLTIPDEGEKPVKGWLVPIHIGYQGIESPVLRRADRMKNDEKIPHAFVECITSLGQYISIRRLLTLQDCYWRYHHNASEQTYYVAARQPE